MTTRTYGNCAEHFAVDKEVHAFSVTLHLNVLDWIHWTIPAHKHNQNSTATNRKYWKSKMIFDRETLTGTAENRWPVLPSLERCIFVPVVSDRVWSVVTVNFWPQNPISSPFSSTAVNLVKFSRTVCKISCLQTFGIRRRMDEDMDANMDNGQHKNRIPSAANHWRRHRNKTLTLNQQTGLSWEKHVINAY